MRHLLRPGAGLAFSLFLFGCAAREEAALPFPPAPPEETPAKTVVVFDPRPDAKAKCGPIGLDAKTIEEECVTESEVAGWIHVGPPGKRKTRYSVVPIGRGAYAIKAEGNRSASGLVKRVFVNPSACPWLEWEWRTDAVQTSADLATKKGDDVAASVGVVFGDPGFLANLRSRPTLRYVWTNGKSAREAVVENPHAKFVRSVVVRNEPYRVGTWARERRNVLADYERAFGGPPEEPIAVVGIYTDNDGTKEPALAFYGSIRFLCGETKTARH